MDHTYTTGCLLFFWLTTNPAKTDDH